MIITFLYDWFIFKYTTYFKFNLYTKFLRCDWIEIYDGPTADKPLIGDRICGNVPPSTIISTTNKVSMKFKSDNSETQSGYEIIVKEIGIINVITYHLLMG